MNGFTEVNPLDVIAEEQADALLPSFAGIDASELQTFVGEEVDWLGRVCRQLVVDR